MGMDDIQKILTLLEDNQKDLRELKRDTTTIKRAIYGDPDNLVSGLIHRQIEDENKIRRLDEFKKKFVWVALGFLAAIEAIKTFLFRI